MTRSAGKTRAFAVSAGLVLMLAAAAPAAACKLTAIGSGTVAAVQDGRTVALADGRVARLIGIETGPGGREALLRLAGGKTLQLHRLDAGRTPAPDRDRYGRIEAFAVLSGAPETVQHMLLTEGHARVSAHVGDKACADALLAAEHDARTARRGLWADPNFAPLAAENLAGLAAAHGHFALVEGKILSVRESGATIYVNFGRRWTRDFTVTIPKRQRRSFAAAGLDLDKLQGRHVRVRGVIERRGGPIIEAAAPEQIEPIN